MQNELLMKTYYHNQDRNAYIQQYSYAVMNWLQITMLHSIVTILLTNTKYVYTSLHPTQSPITGSTAESAWSDTITGTHPSSDACQTSILPLKQYLLTNLCNIIALELKKVIGPIASCSTVSSHSTLPADQLQVYC